MPIKLQCPQCRKGLRVPDQLAGRTGKCPACGAQVSVPPPPPAPQPKPTSKQPASSNLPAAPVLTATLVDEPQVDIKPRTSAPRPQVAGKRSWKFWAVTGGAAIFGLCVLSMLWDLGVASIDSARRNQAQNAGASDGADVETALTRFGYGRHECLVCRTSRSPAARRQHSDDHGFGLCDYCGPRQQATARMIAGGGVGSFEDQQAEQEFVATMRQHLGTEPNAFQTDLIVSLLKFDSPEWNTLYGPP